MELIVTDIKEPTLMGNEELNPKKRSRHPKCLGEKDYFGEFDCGYQSLLMCDDCKYGQGKKDPEAKRNHL